MMLIIRSLIFQLGMWLFTIPFTISILFLIPFKPHTRYKYVSLWAKTMLSWLKITCNLNFKVNGLKNIPQHPFICGQASIGMGNDYSKLAVISASMGT